MSLTARPEGVDEQAPARLRRQGGEELLQRLLASFLAGVPGFLREAQLRLQVGDLLAVARLAHRVKSSCALLGAEHLAAGFEQLETTACESRDRGRCRALLAWLCGEFERVAPWFAALRGPGS